MPHSANRHRHVPPAANDRALGGGNLAFDPRHLILRCADWGSVCLDSIMHLRSPRPACVTLYAVYDDTNGREIRLYCARAFQTVLDASCRQPRAGSSLVPSGVPMWTRYYHPASVLLSVVFLRTAKHRTWMAWARMAGRRTVPSNWGTVAHLSASWPICWLSAVLEVVGFCCFVLPFPFTCRSLHIVSLSPVQPSFTFNVLLPHL